MSRAETLRENYIRDSPLPAAEHAALAPVHSLRQSKQKYRVAGRSEGSLVRPLHFGNLTHNRYKLQIKRLFSSLNSAFEDWACLSGYRNCLL